METLKNVIYAGVGLASVTADKVKETINDLVEKGKISDTEGKKIIDDVIKTTEQTKEDLESKIKSVTDKITGGFDFLNKESNEVTELKKKIEELESKLAEATKKAAAPKKAPSKTSSTTKKTTAKKTTTTAKKAE